MFTEDMTTDRVCWVCRVCSSRKERFDRDFNITQRITDWQRMGNGWLPIVYDKNINYNNQSRSTNY